MSMDNTYYLGFESQEGHISSICEVDFTPIDYQEQWVRFQSSYKYVGLGRIEYTILDNLLSNYDKSEYKQGIISFIGYSNYLYGIYSESFTSDSIFQDFENERKQLSELLSYLKRYLDNEVQSELKSLQIRHESSGGIKIDNFFIINDVLSACCSCWNLNLENFDQRAQELIDNTNELIWSKAGENVKVLLLQSLYNHFHPILAESDNTTYRFIGLILHLSGVSVVRNERIELYESLEDNLAEIPVENVRNYIKRPPKTLLS